MAYSGPSIRSSAAYEPASGTTPTAVHSVTTSGSTVVVIYTCSQTKGIIPSISGGGYSWTTIYNETSASTGRCVGAFIAQGVSSGNLSVVLTWASVTSCHICIYELSPCEVDVKSFYDNTVSTLSPKCSNAGITTTTNVLILAGLAITATIASITQPTSYTLDSYALSGTYIRGVASLQSEAGVTSNTATFTIGTSRAAIGTVFSLRVTATVASVRPNSKFVSQTFNSPTYDNRNI